VRSGRRNWNKQSGVISIPLIRTLPETLTTGRRFETPSLPELTRSSPRYGGEAKVDLQNQLIVVACNVKRWLGLLAQQSSRTKRSQNPVRKMNVKC
jgi:hypothetical protein